MLGDFEILAELGRGAFGSVHKVMRRSDGQMYALKRVRLRGMEQNEISDCLNEVRFLASVRHPNVVGFLESFVEKQDLCIVMELAEQGDLHALIERQQRSRRLLDERLIWTIFIQLAEGLNALHSRNIMHRDIKSANVFLMPDNVVKLGDLNVSKLARGGFARTQIGTPFYMSPEIWENRPYNTKSDMWSLGCVLYECAAGRPPFTGDDLESLGRAVRSGYLTRIPSRYSTDLWTVIQQLLRLNPRDRPSAAQLLHTPEVRKRKRLALSAVDLPDEEDGAAPDMMGTIKVPRNGELRQITNQLPKPCYPESRPDSPNSWPVAHQERRRLRRREKEARRRRSMSDASLGSMSSSSGSSSASSDVHMADADEPLPIRARGSGQQARGSAADSVHYRRNIAAHRHRERLQQRRQPLGPLNENAPAPGPGAPLKPSPPAAGGPPMRGPPRSNARQQYVASAAAQAAARAKADQYRAPQSAYARQRSYSVSSVSSCSSVAPSWWG